MDDLIGKKAYKKYGFYEGLIGTIERNTNGITPYKITFGCGRGVGVGRREDIELIEGRGDDVRRN